MKKQLLCKKDWISEGIIYFKKDTYYEGDFKKDYIRTGIHTFQTKDKNGVTYNFHSGSDYFDI